MMRTSLTKSLVGVALTTGLLLLIPLAAMSLTTEVSWGALDFLVAAVLLLTAGTAIVVGIRRFEGFAQRAAVVAAVASALALVWVELAVGLFR